MVAEGGEGTFRAFVLAVECFTPLSELVVGLQCLVAMRIGVQVENDLVEGKIHSADLLHEFAAILRRVCGGAAFATATLAGGIGTGRGIDGVHTEARAASGAASGSAPAGASGGASEGACPLGEYRDGRSSLPCAACGTATAPTVPSVSNSAAGGPVLLIHHNGYHAPAIGRGRPFMCGDVSPSDSTLSAAGLYAAGRARAATEGQIQFAEQSPAPEGGVGVIECTECLAGRIDHSQGVIGKAKAVRATAVKAATGIVHPLLATATAVFGGSHLGDGQNARGKQILFHIVPPSLL